MRYRYAKVFKGLITVILVRIKTVIQRNVNLEILVIKLKFCGAYFKVKKKKEWLFNLT